MGLRLRWLVHSPCPCVGPAASPVGPAGRAARTAWSGRLSGLLILAAVIAMFLLLLFCFCFLLFALRQGGCPCHRRRGGFGMWRGWYDRGGGLSVRPLPRRWRRALARVPQRGVPFGPRPSHGARTLVVLLPCRGGYLADHKLMWLLRPRLRLRLWLLSAAASPVCVARSGGPRWRRRRRRRPRGGPASSWMVAA